MIKSVQAIACLVAFTWMGFAAAQQPAGYPWDYDKTVAAARREGTVVVYGNTDMVVARYLVQDFTALYPGVKVDYRDIESADIYQRFMQEAATNTDMADVLWSSAMDLQVKLVNDGHGQRYVSPESPHLPAWAIWKSEAYGTTFEPIGFAYNKQHLSEAEVPRTHGDLVRLLAAPGERFKSRVTTYDLENSGLGFLFATQDAKTSNMFWDVARTLGRNDTGLQTSTADMLQSVASGKSILAYNVLSSYAAGRAHRNPAVGFAYPLDYTLVVSRIAFINKRAPHPNAARLWLDYLLSQRGQTVMAQQSDLFALRADVQGGQTAESLTRTLGPSLKPIAIGPSLMVYLDRAKRGDFLKKWKQALKPVKD
jgi:iron(III) transport system substrate-binding protein